MFNYNYKIKFSNCDPGGVIYFAEIFDIAHEAYEAFLIEAGSMKNYFDDKLVAIPIIKAEAEYKSPITMHELIIISIKVKKVGESSFVLNYLFNNESGKIKAEVTTVHVTIDKKTGDKIKLPSELREYFSANQE